MLQHEIVLMFTVTPTAFHYVFRFWDEVRDLEFHHQSNYRAENGNRAGWYGKSATSVSLSIPYNCGTVYSV